MAGGSGVPRLRVSRLQDFSLQNLNIIVVLMMITYICIYIYIYGHIYSYGHMALKFQELPYWRGPIRR